MSIQFLVILLVFSIPILGIGLAGYKEWLKFKSKHQKLGSSTQEVESKLNSLRDTIREIEEERDALLQRVQNLETIVTSEAWIVQHDDASEAPALDTGEAGELTLPTDAEDEATSEAERTANIARRLRNQ